MPDPYREPIEDGQRLEKKSEISPLEQKENKESIQEKIQEAPSPKPNEMPIMNAPSPVFSSAQTTKQEPDQAEKDRQLKLLVDMAFSDGINKAIEAAQATENPYLIDEFHDLLVDELYQQLVQKGKIKES